MSRVLKTGNNQITQSYQAHYNKVQNGQGWAIGTDVVKHQSQLDYIIAHSSGTVIKVIDYLDGTNGVLDREGMGYGNYVMILHSNNIVTVYAHLTKVTVKQGQKVDKGTSIAYMGNTGGSFGAHLHFEVRQYKTAPTTVSLHDKTKFEFLNPEKYLDADLPNNSTNVNVAGYLDTVKYEKNILSCTGWAYQGAGSQTVTIKILNGTKEVKKFDIVANKSRPDVKAAMGYSTDKVGFSGSSDVSALGNGTYTVKAYVGTSQLNNTKTFTISNATKNVTTLTATSYPDYGSNANQYYRVRKSYTDAKSSKGSFWQWKGAFDCWNAWKSEGYHVYDNNGKQLDVSTTTTNSSTTTTVKPTQATQPVKAELNNKSYPNYTGNKHYYVQKKFKSWADSKGAFQSWTNAFNEWNKNKNNGYHVYDNEGNQLD